MGERLELLVLLKDSTMGPADGHYRVAFGYSTALVARLHLPHAITKKLHGFLLPVIIV